MEDPTIERFVHVARHLVICVGYAMENGDDVVDAVIRGFTDVLGEDEDIFHMFSWIPDLAGRLEFFGMAFLRADSRYEWDRQLSLRLKPASLLTLPISEAVSRLRG